MTDTGLEFSYNEFLSAFGIRVMLASNNEFDRVPLLLFPERDCKNWYGSLKFW